MEASWDLGRGRLWQTKALLRPCRAVWGPRASERAHTGVCRVQPRGVGKQRGQWRQSLFQMSEEMEEADTGGERRRKHRRGDAQTEDGETDRDEEDRDMEGERSIEGEGDERQREGEKSQEGGNSQEW